MDPDSRTDLLVDPQVLVALVTLDAPEELTLLDVRYEVGRSDGHEQYLAGHVPGAVYVDLDTDLADPVGDGSRGRHPLPDEARFAEAMRRCGVTAGRPVVVYDGGPGYAATRAWWLLTYHGHPDVRVLDGGLAGYVAAGGELATGEEGAPAGDFEADPGHLPVVDADGALALARDSVLIDVRAGERFRGETEPLDPVAGHIPGAVNVPFAATNLAADGDGPGRFRRPEELRTAYDAAGARPGADVGVYCGSGVTATHTVFALRRLGIDAALYPGSWSEWVADAQRPVATGE